MSEPGLSKVLVAHRDERVAAQLDAWLREWGFVPHLAATADAAWEVLSCDDAPRFVILATSLDGMGAVELCRAARARPLEPYVYIALVGEVGTEPDYDACIDAGADDYFGPPLDPRDLRLRIESGRRVARLQDDLIAARESLRSRASCDALTGVWNRETVMTILAREVSRATRDATDVAVLMADVDYFKRINDNYGHHAGDVALREIARRMARMVRPYDALGRYGGEEFLFVLPNCDREKAVAAAERVLEAISREPIGLPSGPLRVTVSIGVSATGPTPRLELDQVVKAADAALYRAKANGRARVELDIRDPADAAGAEGAASGAALRETANRLVVELIDAASKHDVREVRVRSRALRRVANGLGARGVVHLTRTLDARAEAGHWETACGAVEAIATEVSRFAQQIAAASGG